MSVYNLTYPRFAVDNHKIQRLFQGTKASSTFNRSPDKIQEINKLHGQYNEEILNWTSSDRFTMDGQELTDQLRFIYGSNPPSMETLEVEYFDGATKIWEKYTNILKNL